MATISITIPDANLADVLDAFAAKFNFATYGAGLTKAQFAKSKVADFIKNVYVSEQVKIAATSITNAAYNTANQVVIT